MTTNQQQIQSAKIYEFPLRGRFASAHTESIGGIGNASYPSVASFDSWYHEEAMRDAGLIRKH